MASQAKAQQYGSGRILYHRLMLPNWLRNNATWPRRDLYEGDDLNLRIKPDDSDWDNIFRVKLLPAGQLKDNADITVTMKVGVLLPEPRPTPPPRDPMSYMISDGKYSIGIQLLDPTHDYATSGPYKAVEGHSSRVRLTNPNTDLVSSQDLVKTNSRNNPDQFELTFKPSEYFGSAYCAIDDGHKLVVQYSDALELSKGLQFELYRFKSTERYTINYVEVTIFEDSPKI